MSERGRLALLSFLMLFVELTLIRWIGSNVVFLSYFSNFVLLGSFLGIGIGFLRGTTAYDLFPWAPVMLAFLVAFVGIFPVVLACSQAPIIYFGCDPTGLPIWVTLPAIFLAVAVVMAAIAQGVAKSFATFEPLEAYRLDILGSLAGIAAFSLLAFLQAPPFVWDVVISSALIALYYPSIRLVQIVAIAATLFIMGKESFAAGDSWSPYYKISVFPVGPRILGLYVNGIPHQEIESLADRKRVEPIYFLPYRRLRANPLRDVLIVGAGNGGDVAIALAAGAKHVDAVEIDPRIYAIGRALDPDHPYQNPRVSVHIDDGRAFLERSHHRYDLILFALPDSLTLVSGQSSLRLESYLFTAQAMAAARAHLSDAGAFGMYNYYRRQWLLDRLAGSMQGAFGNPPCVDSESGSAGTFGLLVAGRVAANVTCKTTWSPALREVPRPADDDAPFLYLNDRSIPPLYLITIAAILIASLALIRGAAGPLQPMRPYADLFFMGAAFMLLETKNVVGFALLFGTTWFVNALVFFGVLLSVLAAIEVARRVRVPHPGALYVALFTALAVAWSVPPAALLALEVVPRFVIAASLAFAPIFIANLIFAERFRDVGTSTIAFGANLLGAMAGGLVEYASLVVGYRALLPIVGAMYLLAFILRPRVLASRDATGHALSGARGETVPGAARAPVAATAKATVPGSGSG
jgi:SAM-dependent methyltransferase